MSQPENQPVPETGTEAPKDTSGSGVNDPSAPPHEPRAGAADEVAADELATDELNAGDLATDELDPGDLPSGDAAGATQSARKRRRRKRKRNNTAAAQDANESGDEPQAEGSMALPGADSAAPAPTSGALTPKEIEHAARAVQFLGKNAELLSTVLTPEVQALLTQPEADRTIFERLQALLGSALSAEHLARVPEDRRDALIGEAFEACPTLEVLCARLDNLAKSGFDPLSNHEALRRADAARVTAEQLQRWISLSDQLIAPAARLEWLLAALENRELKRALDAHPKLLPAPWTSLLPAARSLLTVIVRGQSPHGPLRVLHDALRSLLNVGAHSLDNRSVAVRERCVGWALELRLNESQNQALERLLQTLGGEEIGFELELQRVRGWLATGRHAEAEARLQALAARAPGRGPVNHWLKALTGPRFGNLALLRSRVNPPLPHPQALRPGFSFVDQCEVWVRVGSPEEAPQFVEQIEVHRRALLPSVVKIHEAGFTNSRRPFVGYSRKGENARYALLPSRGLTRREALNFAQQLLHLGFALARAGVVLQDAELGRFELSASGQLWLVESWGSRLESTDKALEGMLAIVRQWQLTLLQGSNRFALPAEARENLTHAGDFQTVRAVLENLGRNYYWGE